MIRAIIVDDEKHGRENLKILLKQICPDDIEVVDAVSSVNEAFLSIKKHQPDVVFLDINMPTGNGFSLLENWDYDFQVIFVTVHDEYAIKAFRYAAIDYILKPINILHLEQAVQRLKKYQKPLNDVSLQAISYYQEKKQFDKIVVPAPKGYCLINLNDILYIEAQGSYAKLSLNNNEQDSVITSKPLSYYEKTLSESSFFRVHRTHLVNLSHITIFNTQEYFVVLTNKAQISVSQRKKQMLIDKLSNFNTD